MNKLKLLTACYIVALLVLVIGFFIGIFAGLGVVQAIVLAPIVVLIGLGLSVVVYRRDQMLFRIIIYSSLVFTAIFIYFLITQE